MERDLTILRIGSPHYSSSASGKAISFKSEPVKKKLVLPLTEQTLALHNGVELKSQRHRRAEADDENENVLEKALLDKVNERFDNIQLDFEEKIKVRTCKIFYKTVILTQSMIAIGSTVCQSRVRFRSIKKRAQ